MLTNTQQRGKDLPNKEFLLTTYSPSFTICFSPLPIFMLCQSHRNKAMPEQETLTAV